MMEDLSLVFYTLGALFLLTCIPNIFNALKARSQLSGIPTIGPSGILISYIGAIKFFFNARSMIQEGYDRYPGKAFKVPTLFRWTVVVSGDRMVDDIRRATDDQLSFQEAVAKTIQTNYTIGPEVERDLFHVATVRSPLTRNLATRFVDVQDEIECAFGDLIPAKEGRDPDYRALNEEFTVDVVKGANIITMFPDVLKPIAGYLFTNVQPSIRRAIGHLGPLIQERLDKGKQYGPDWPEKPNDLITWLLEEAPSHLRTIREVTLRVLMANFAAIHTTSMAFTQVLYDLAVHPEYVLALREEVEAIIEDEGLTKAALGRMRKLDSFVKESQRLYGIGALIMDRWTVKDYTFSDGTVVPAGHAIAVALDATHRDEKNYPNAHEFDGFRFARMRENESESIKHQVVSLGLDFVSFGNGRHACPGRFFAANELKAMLAHVLLNYDVKMEGGNERPPNMWFAYQAVPNPTACVLFRKRATSGG